MACAEDNICDAMLCYDFDNYTEHASLRRFTRIRSNISVSDGEFVCIVKNELTYIHNWPLQPFSQDYGLVSHTTHVVCVNFIHE